VFFARAHLLNFYILLQKKKIINVLVNETITSSSLGKTIYNTTSLLLF
jgi:hypothetical protein